MAAMDWLVVAGYFALILGLAWWVILQGKDTATDYFLAGRHLGWFVVGASIFARTSARSISWVWPARARRTAWPWRTTSCTRGACWCWAG